MKLNLPAFVTFAFVFCLLSSGAMALSVSVTQSGADSDEVMKGRTFTVEASGWTGDCSTATVSFDGCSSCSLSGEDSMKTVGGGASSVTWTTVSATTSASSQYVTVTLSGGCGTQSGDSSSFDIVLPPLLSITASPNTDSVNSGNSITANINIENGGETTANDLVISVGGSSGISGSCDPISGIDESSNAAETCTVTTSDGLSTANRTVSFTVSSTNADDATGSFQLYVIGSGGSGDDNGPDGSSSPSGGAAPTDSETVTQTITVGQIQKGAQGKAVFTTSGFYLSEVTVTPKENSNNVKFTAVQTVFKPANVTEPPGLKYVYFDIKALNLRNENISTATVKFKIENAWMERNNIGNDDVVMKRFSNGQWEELETSFNSLSGNFSYFTAVTPGFSFFVITVKDVAAQTESACSSGNLRCSGNDVQQCSNSSVWETVETCEFGCNESSLLCNTELPEGMSCTPDEKRCYQGSLEQCMADGSGWEVLEVCEYGCNTNIKECAASGAQSAGEGLPWWSWVLVIAVIVCIAMLVLHLKKR